MPSDQRAKATAPQAAPLLPNVDAAIAALVALRPDCAWTLSAIGNDGIVTRGFHGHVQKDEVREWIASHQAAGRNVYFAPNRSRDPSRRASEADIVEVLYLHVDLDPEGPAATHAEQRERFARALQQRKATAIIASGRGVQGLWRLAAPIDPALAKRANKAIAAALGGDSAHDLARILRVPGTVNYPNAKKAAQGCSPVLAAAVELSERTMTFDDVLAAFGLTRATLPELSPARAPKATGAVRSVHADVGTPGPGGGGGAAPFALDDLPRLFGSKGAEIARTFKNKKGELYSDRSAGSFEFALAAARWKAPPELVVAALLDRRLPISDHIYDAGPTGNRTAADYARKQVDDAIAKVALEREGLAAPFSDVPEGFDVPMRALSAAAVREAEELHAQLVEKPRTLEDDIAELMGPGFANSPAAAASGAEPEPAPGPGGVGERSTIASQWSPLSPHFLADDPPPLPYLVALPSGAGLLPRGKAGLLSAEGGIGKSFAMLQLAVSVATGRTWLGSFQVPEDQRGRCLLLLGEEDEGELHRRLWSVAQVLDLSDEERAALVRRVVALPLAGRSAPLLRLEGGNVATTAELRTLVARLREDGEPWALIVVDPLSRFAGIDAESDNRLATSFVQAIESLTAAPGAPAVIVTAHSSKAVRQRNDVDARGVSGLTDGFRWHATLLQHDKVDDLVLLRVGKNNYARALREPFPLRRQRGGLLLAETGEQRVAREREEELARDREDDKKRQRQDRRVERSAEADRPRILRAFDGAPRFTTKDAVVRAAGMNLQRGRVALDLAMAEGLVAKVGRVFALTENGQELARGAHL